MTDYWTTYKLSLLVAKTNRLGAHSTLRVKKPTLDACPYAQNPFTIGLTCKRVMKQSLKIPPPQMCCHKIVRSKCRELATITMYSCGSNAGIETTASLVNAITNNPLFHSQLAHQSSAASNHTDPFV